MRRAPGLLQMQNSPIHIQNFIIRRRHCQPICMRRLLPCRKSRHGCRGYAREKEGMRGGNNYFIHNRAGILGVCVYMQEYAHGGDQEAGWGMV